MKISLRAARINQGLTQKQAGDKIGVSKDTVSKWERGECIPNLKHIPSIEKAYNVKYDDLIFLPRDYALSVQNNC